MTAATRMARRSSARICLHSRWRVGRCLAWARTADAKMWNGADVDFTREASVIPLVPAGPDDIPTPSPVALIRNDEIVLDAASGAFSVKQGATMIWLDIESVSVSEARSLAAALIELADHSDGVTR